MLNTREPREDAIMAQFSIESYHWVENPVEVKSDNPYLLVGILAAMVFIAALGCMIVWGGVL